MAKDLRKKLESLTVDELRTYARKLQIERLSSLSTKQMLIDGILECNHSTVRRLLRLTWIDSHRLGIILGIAGIVLTVIFGLVALPFQPAKQENAQNLSEYGWIKISVDRRNAFQNAEFDRWINRTVSFRQRYSTESPPSKTEYGSFIAEFTEFAEQNFTQAQIDCFNLAFGSGCAISHLENFENLKREMQEQTSQLGLIEWYLKEYIKFNRKNVEPRSPEW